MTDEELIAYFEHTELPESVRLDRAITQHNVRETVKQNLESMRADLKDMRSRHRLRRIATAIDHPYDGPEIPRF
jgi:hypothetical protein